MHTIKQFNHRFLFLAAFLLLFSLSAACAGQQTEESGPDFGNEKQQSAPNAFQGNKKTEKPGGESGGLQINKVTGHKWMLIYTHASQSAELQVSIVSWDEDRLTLTDVHYNCAYTFDDTSPYGSGVLLKLNSIQNNIRDCYDQAGFSPSSYSVPAVELYPSVQFEVIGEWTKRARGALVKHASFDYMLNNDTLVLAADGPAGLGNRKIKSESRPLLAGGPFHAASNFEFWNSLYPSPKGQVSFVEHYAWNTSGKVTNITPKNEVEPSLMRILLSDTEMLIDPPAGFNLDTLIIDPKHFGTGGG